MKHEGFMSNDEEDKGRVTEGKRRREDDDGGLRPQLLNQIIGQERIVENLKILVAAAKARKEPLDHIIFYGPPGIGKTTLSNAMANEMGVRIRPTTGPAIERGGDLAAILSNLRAGEVL